MTQMIINFTDSTAVSRVRALLKLVHGVDSIRVKKPTNVITPELAKEIEEAREEYRRGETIHFETLEDMDAWFDSL